ncbi:MAG: (d)CMP kinase, partial [Alphaproteobacteria bacterium]
MIIAIDGPSAAGKGTLARRLAAHLGFAYLDSGKLYRAVGLSLVRQGKDPSDSEAAVAVAQAIRLEDADDPELGSDEAARAATIVATIG